MKNAIFILSSALVLFVINIPLISQAEQNQAEQKNSPIRYQIELIIFAYQQIKTNEYWDQDEIASIDWHPQPADELVAYQPETTTSVVQQGQQMASNPAEFRLSNIAKKLQRSSDYKLLFHQAWQQALPRYQKGHWLKISDLPLKKGNINKPSFDKHTVILSDEQAIAKLEGRIKVFRKRFFHVALEMLYHSDYQNPETGTHPEPQLSEYQAIEPQTVSFYFKQQQQVALNKIYYFDHPVIAGLIYITKYHGKYQ